MGRGFRGFRVAGAICLAWAAFAQNEAEAEDAAIDCGPAWHQAADQRAAYGLGMLQEYAISGQVALWRLMTSGDGTPTHVEWGYQDGPVLPAEFPDDPDAERILDLVRQHQLQQAADEIVALTHIPDPKASDVATERTLARNEVLLAAVLWSNGPSGGSELSQGVKKRMALLDAHFLSLPLSILSADEIVERAYWRALDDMRWFLPSGGFHYSDEEPIADDWWLPNSAGAIDYLRGVADATRESELLDWLQSLEQLGATANGPWIGYLKQRSGTPEYANAMAHILAMAQTGTALPWKLMAMRWMSPAMLSDPAVAAAAESIDRDIDALEERAGHCDLALGEQYAMGGLRHDRMRLRALRFQASTAGNLAWNHEIAITEAATTDNFTRDEVARFAMAVGQPEIARAFAPPRDDYPGGNAFAGAPLRAMTALDLESFAATNPASSALNVLPLRLLEPMVEGPGLRKDLRAAVARMAWTRAFVLDDQPILKRITPLLAQTNPQLKPLVDAYQAAWTDAGARHAGIVLLLKTPSMQMVLPDEGDLFWGIPRLRLWRDEDWPDAVLKADHLNRNDNNWWCRLDPAQLSGRLRQSFYNPVVGLANYTPWDPYWPSGWEPLDSDFTVQTLQELDRYRDRVLGSHAILRQIDWDELGRLAQIPAAPVYLTGQAVAWAEGSWWDWALYPDRIADALALSIQTSKWGCTREGPNGETSRRAFVTLKRYFPDSEAAKSTRYWYN